MAIGEQKGLRTLLDRLQESSKVGLKFPMFLPSNPHIGQVLHQTGKIEILQNVVIFYFKPVTVSSKSDEFMQIVLLQMFIVRSQTSTTA